MQALSSPARDALDGEHRDGGEHAKDHDDDEELDEGESLVALGLDFGVDVHDERSSELMWFSKRSGSLCLRQRKGCIGTMHRGLEVV